MTVSERVHRDPIGGEIAVLEDEQFMARAIADELQVHTGAICEIVGNMNDFARVMKSRRFDVVSIDWELHNAYRGRDALAIARREQPEAARIVYTKHRAEIPRAVPCGADAALVKPAGINLDRYKVLVKRGIRLGMARRIVAELRRYDGHTLPKLRSGQLVDKKTEGVICETSLSVARQMRLEHLNGKGLVELLIRRNWWSAFNETAYVAMPWNEKLAYLLRAVSMKESNTARILGMSRESVIVLLTEGGLAGGMPVEMGVRARQLLSALGYVLRLAEYEPELMVEFWGPSSDGRPRLTESPWKHRGLGSYLIRNGPAGLVECIDWMRRQ